MAATGRTCRRSGPLHTKILNLLVNKVRQFVILSLLITVIYDYNYYHATVEGLQILANSNSTIANVTLSNSSITTVNNNISEIRTPSNSNKNLDDNEELNKGTTVLLSGEEFVDYTEAPMLLFDNTDKINNDNLSKIKAQNVTTDGPKLIVNDTRMDFFEPEITTPIPTNSSTTLETSIKNEELEDDGEEEDDLSSIDDQNNSNNSTNQNSTEKPFNVDGDFEKPQNISQYMDYIEKLFHELRHQVSDLFEPHIPKLIRTSQSVMLSNACSFDMLRMAFALRQFEPWALKMIDSSGKLPEGILEGSFTALGSYDQCLSVSFGESSSSDAPKATSTTTTTTTANNKEELGGEQRVQPTTQGKYCLVTISPFMPPKPPVERVERMFQDEANRRNYTQDNQFSRLSPMFYYMKFRIGVCIPSTCEQTDLDSISNTLSTNLKLNITIPDCRIKTIDSQMSNYQLVAGIILGIVLALIVVSTFCDCYKQQCQNLRKRELKLLGVNAYQAKNVPRDDLVIKMGQNGCEQNITSERDQFLKSLQSHWSWLSFSLITNFKLYFGSNIGKDEEKQSLNRNEHESRQEQPIVIKCLNGIRVISLCWVIIANSYLTLDPRATKRLTKTREAPRDFMFQIVAQASLAIETFFFLSGLLMSLSFSRKFKSYFISTSNSSAIEIEREESKKSTRWLQWVHFYIHRYIRMTPATMLIIALSMYSYHYADGPIWFEATKKAHDSCKQNWWLHMLHVANFIDTRQMCFIHYWYISADMQLFLLAPILLFLILKYKYLGYTLVGLIASGSIFSVFHTTYVRNLPPTLLFYSSDPESRREFGNTIMTKPLTHVLPYIVGMFVGQWLATRATTTTRVTKTTGVNTTSLDSSLSDKSTCHQILGNQSDHSIAPIETQWKYLKQENKHNLTNTNGGHLAYRSKNISRLLASFAMIIALAEVFLPYKWNNSHLPTRLLASIYASLFRLAWSLVLAYVVISCAHRRTSKCQKKYPRCKSCQSSINDEDDDDCEENERFIATNQQVKSIPKQSRLNEQKLQERELFYCFCSSGGNFINRMLSLDIFTPLSKLSFVAYLIHLPLMSLFVQQTRGLFAFSHTLVIHLALSYLVMTFLLSFALVHIIEFPFLTFERLLFERIMRGRQMGQLGTNSSGASIENRQKLSLVVGTTTTASSSKCYNVNVISGKISKPQTMQEADDELGRGLTNITASSNNESNNGNLSHRL